MIGIGTDHLQIGGWRFSLFGLGNLLVCCSCCFLEFLLCTNYYRSDYFRFPQKKLF